MCVPNKLTQLTKFPLTLDEAGMIYYSKPGRNKVRSTGTVGAFDWSVCCIEEYHVPATAANPPRFAWLREPVGEAASATGKQRSSRETHLHQTKSVVERSQRRSRTQRARQKPGPPHIARSIRHEVKADMGRIYTKSHPNTFTRTIPHAFWRT